MRDLLTTVLEVLGVVAFVAGVAMIFIPAALMVLGAAMFGASYLMVRSTGEDTS